MDLVPQPTGHLGEDCLERVDTADERPDVNLLSIRANGSAVLWSPEFRRAMMHLCRMRGLDIALSVPDRLLTVALKSQGILLLWPAPPDDPRGSPVTLTHQGRRCSTELEEAFNSLGVSLPEGIFINIPVTHHMSPKYGPCFALHFNQAEFCFKESQVPAIGLQGN